MKEEVSCPFTVKLSSKITYPISLGTEGREIYWGKAIFVTCGLLKKRMNNQGDLGAWDIR